MTRAGKLPHYITIETTSESQGSDGANIIAWTTFAQVWASIETPSGREYYSSDAHNADVTHIINIRYLPGVTRKMRVSWDGRTFLVDWFQKIGERDFDMQLFCTEQI